MDLFLWMIFLEKNGKKEKGQTLGHDGRKERGEGRKTRGQVNILGI
jgi:hypothetical protein